MSKDNGTKGKIEVERYNVAEGYIVVHGAQITCNNAGGSETPNYLTILDGHGIMEAGKHCAHDAACVPIKNISPFASCANSNVGKVLSELLVTATSDAAARYKNALDVYNGNVRNHTWKAVPCALPLLDRWFDANEEDIVTKSVGMDKKVLGIIASLANTMPGLVGKAARYILYDKYEYDKSSIETDVLTEKEGQLYTIKANIETLLNESKEAIEKSAQIVGEDFNYIISELKTVKSNMNKILTYWEDAYKIYPKLQNYKQYKESLKNHIKDIDTMVNEIKDWKEEEYHLITEESFLVCRCGGIITVAKNGQKYGKTVKALTNSITTMTTEFRVYCNERHHSEGTDVSAQERTAFAAAAKELEYMEKFFFDVENISDPNAASVYLELVCHSFNDEMDEQLKSMLSLISFGYWPLSVFLSLLTLADPEKGAEGVVDSASAYIDLLGTIAEGGGGLSTAGKVVVKTNSLFSILSSISNFFYVSYDTWVENVKITVFTDSHAFVWEQMTTEEGKLGKMIKMAFPQTKANYTEGRKKADLEWKEEPGVFMKRRIHINDGKDEVKKIDSETDFSKEIHLFK